jgi:hypothetical protein
MTVHDEGTRHFHSCVKRANESSRSKLGLLCEISVDFTNPRRKSCFAVHMLARHLLRRLSANVKAVSHGIAPVGLKNFVLGGTVAMSSNRLNTFAYYDTNDNFEIKHQSAEEKLHEDVMIPLNAEDDVAELKSRRVCLPGSKDLLPKQLADVRACNIPIFLVGGTSAPAKRLFALKHVAMFQSYKLKEATLYVRPYDLDFFNEGSEDVEALVEWIKKEISERYGSFDKLDMHVSLVLEGDRKSNGFLDDKENLSRLAESLKHLANSTRLVVCGSGLFGMKHVSAADMMVIHCKEAKWVSRLMGRSR